MVHTWTIRYPFPVVLPGQPGFSLGDYEITAPLPARVFQTGQYPFSVLGSRRRGFHCATIAVSMTHANWGFLISNGIMISGLWLSTPAGKFIEQGQARFNDLR